MTELFSNPEFVYTLDPTNNYIIGGGYKIESFFLQNEYPTMTTINSSDQEGGKVSSIFENLAVPAGLFYNNSYKQQKEDSDDSKKYYKHHEMLPDDLFDKLFGLIEYNKKRQRQTRKSNNKSNKNNTNKNKTRKQNY